MSEIYDLKSVVGIDEAGRGALAGELFVAACLLKCEIAGIRDSKELSAKRRSELFKEIKAHSNYLILAFSPTQIDELGLSWCLRTALLVIKAHFSGLKCEFLYDGNVNFGVNGIKTLVKADSKVMQVGAASILAKVSRDALMGSYDENYDKKFGSKFARYGFAKHKGYASKAHIEAIKKFGLSKIHRKSFHLKALERGLFG